MIRHAQEPFTGIGRGWQIETDATSEWLFLRLRVAEHDFDSEPRLAEAIWAVAQQHGVDKLILELDSMTWLSSYLVGQLVLIHKRIHSNGGTFRLCGLSSDNYLVIDLMRLGDRFFNYATRYDAVRDYRPDKPR